MSPLAEEAYALIRRIPAGKCTTYGAIGRALPHNVSGLTIGRWMAVAPPDVPWQRVVGIDGTILTAKKDPHLGLEQERRLRDEGVSFTEDGRVEIDKFYFEP